MATAAKNCENLIGVECHFTQSGYPIFVMVRVLKFWLIAGTAKVPSSHHTDGPYVYPASLLVQVAAGTYKVFWSRPLVLAELSPREVVTYDQWVVL